MMCFQQSWHRERVNLFGPLARKLKPEDRRLADKIISNRGMRSEFLGAQLDDDGELTGGWEASDQQIRFGPKVTFDDLVRAGNVGLNNPCEASHGPPLKDPMIVRCLRQVLNEEEGWMLDFDPSHIRFRNPPAYIDAAVESGILQPCLFFSGTWSGGGKKKRR